MEFHLLRNSKILNRSVRLNVKKMGNNYYEICLDAYLFKSRCEFLLGCHIQHSFNASKGDRLAEAYVNRLTPNDPYMGRIAPLTSKRCILYIYSTNIGTEYFKHALYFPFFFLQNAVCFIMLTCLVPVLFTFHIQVC